MNIYTISFLLILVFDMFKNQEYLRLLQYNLYNEDNRYLKWIFKHIKDCFLTIDLLSLITIIVAYYLNNKYSGYLVFLSLIFYYLDVVNRVKKPKYKNIKQLVVTKRIKRLILTLAILYLLPIVVYLSNKDNGLLLVVISGFITYFSFLMVLVAKILNKPVDTVIDRLEKEKAIQKLDSMKKLNVIGITGTFGKNSCASILEDLLNDKYITRKTPRNINTLSALSKTVNSHLDRYDQVFIASIGTYKKYEIDRICEIIKPKYGVLTSIDLDNVESFYDYKSVIKENFKLIEHLPSSGVAILNRDDLNQTSHNIKSKCKKIWISIDNKKSNYRATNIKYSYNGTKFEVNIDGKDYTFETRLLGRYNVYNILASIALGIEFGISIDELQKMVRRIRVTKNKLEIKEYDNMYQINDRCNTNPTGIKVALEVLNDMDGAKVIGTRGINYKKIDYMFGTEIAKKDIDKVILIDSKETRKVFDGLLENGYDKERIDIVNSVNDAYNLLDTYKFKKKMYVLFENNLKDSYNSYRKKEIR